MQHTLRQHVSEGILPRFRKNALWLTCERWLWKGEERPRGGEMQRSSWIFLFPPYSVHVEL